MGVELPLSDKLASKCLELLEGLLAHNHGHVFATPVNPVELSLDDYFDIIKKPMDLGTIQMNLMSGSYRSLDDFQSDVHLTFKNAMLYNVKGSVVYGMAVELKGKFETDFKKIIITDKGARSEYSVCGLCGRGERKFEHPMIFCQCVNCRDLYVRRNTFFFVSADKQYACCKECYEAEKNPEGIIDFGSTKIKKSELSKRKNDEVHEESWVQCDDCKRWIHQICGMYNNNTCPGEEEGSAYYLCPLCLLSEREEYGDPPTLHKAPSANDIPRTKLSDWLEKHVSKNMDEQIKKLAEEKARAEVRTLWSPLSRTRLPIPIQL